MNDLLIVALAEAAIIVVLVVALVSREHDHDEETRWMVDTQAKELDTLVQRVQAPERTPVLPQHWKPNDEVDPAEVEAKLSEERKHRAALASVGTVPQAE